MVNSALQRWNQTPAEQRWLYLAGSLLLLSGLVHTGVWLLDGGSWEGPLSWRKPILFGLSGGITTISVGWVLGLVRRWSLDGWLSFAFAGMILVEVFLITMQTWRGTASHFNESTFFDAVVFHWMGYLVTAISVLIALLTWRSFGPLRTTAPMSVAVRSGMSLLLFSCLFGFFMIWHGEQQIAQAANPGTYGSAGAMKFPHGIPMHAIQWLPLTAFLLRISRLSVNWQLWGTWSAVVAQVGLTGYSLWQTLAGRSRFDLTIGSGVLLAISLIAFVVPWLLIAWQWIPQERMPRPHSLTPSR